MWLCVGGGEQVFAFLSLGKQAYIAASAQSSAASRKRLTEKLPNTATDVTYSTLPTVKSLYLHTREQEEAYMD